MTICSLNEKWRKGETDFDPIYNFFKLWNKKDFLSFNHNLTHNDNFLFCFLGYFKTKLFCFNCVIIIKKEKQNKKAPFYWANNKAHFNLIEQSLYL